MSTQLSGVATESADEPIRVVTTSIQMISCRNWAGGEMADTLALGASAARHGGSSPPLPTIDVSIFYVVVFVQT
jgi:hypothetical protein